MPAPRDGGPGNGGVNVPHCGPTRYRSGHNGADSKSDGRVKPARGFDKRAGARLDGVSRPEGRRPGRAQAQSHPLPPINYLIQTIRHAASSRVTPIPSSIQAWAKSSSQVRTLALPIRRPPDVPDAGTGHGGPGSQGKSAADAGHCGPAPRPGGLTVPPGS